MWCEREHVTTICIQTVWILKCFDLLWSTSIELWTEQSLLGPEDMKQKSMESHWRITRVFLPYFFLQRLWMVSVYVENMRCEYPPWLFFVYIYIYLFEYRMNQIYMEYYMVGGFCGCSQVSKPNHHVGSNELCLHIFAAQHWALLFGLCPVTSLHMHHLESRDFVFCICV